MVLFRLDIRKSRNLATKVQTKEKQTGAKTLEGLSNESLAHLFFFRFNASLTACLISSETQPSHLRVRLRRIGWRRRLCSLTLMKLANELELSN